MTVTGAWARVLGMATIVVAASGICASTSAAQDAPSGDTQGTPERPKILPNRRWAEDWSVLADPRSAREPLDGLKYIAFSVDHPETYLSLGLNIRERVEIDHAPFFGVPPGQKGEWGLSRLEWHADLHLGSHVQIFSQFQSAYAPGKPVQSPVDRDRLDVEQAFIGVSEPIRGGTLRLRVGRQLIAIDLQRFASVRDGPNLRQPYDAAYADYERGVWRVTGAYTRPVETHDVRPFDDYSDNRLTFSGILLRRQVRGLGQVSASYTRYKHDAAVFANAPGDERRDIVDLRFNGARGGLDWDIEAMKQTGRFGAQRIEAGAFGLLGGYTFAGTAWAPRLGASIDVATGDHDARDQTLETFNPLFPNGYYLADYTGYPNLIHLKPVMTLHPTRSLNLMTAVAAQWRQTTGDAIYIFPGFPLAGTAGSPQRYTGTYGEVRVDWIISPHYSVGCDVVHYAIGSAIRTAGGHDANYGSVEIRYGW